MITQENILYTADEIKAMVKTIEELRKKYNKALERARYYHSKDYMLINSAIENIFPELAESEDERIRKDIISYLRNEKIVKRYISDIEIDKWIAWLEKQGQTFTKKDVDDAYLQGICDTKHEIEKRSEQLPADKIEPKFHEDKWITNGEYTWKIVGVKPLDYILQSQDGNTVDDTISYVDEQFHLWTITDAKDGDWVILDGTVAKILDKQKYGFVGLDIDGKDFFCNYGHTDSMHLWSINDAKDGDVLARNNDILSICIFSHFDGINNKYSSFLCHCGLEGEGLGQELSINGYHDDSKDYVPATKEQRDLLFAKMHDAGYAWDSEKKELKKIEPKTLDADKVIGWLVANICDFDYYVKLFKQDFEL